MAVEKHHWPLAVFVLYSATMKSLVKMPPGYPQLLRDLKEKIRSAQVKAALSVNHELIKLYWEIGKMIVDKQKNEKWGAGFIGKLAQDLQNNFPGTEGFSKSNVFRIKAFYLNRRAVLHKHQFWMEVKRGMAKPLTPRRGWRIAE